MSKSIEAFDIKLDNTSAIFAPGSLITGRIILDLNKPKSCRAIKLRIKGRCKVHWAEVFGTYSMEDNDSVKDSYKGQEEYFYNDICLHGDINGGSLEVPAGHHEYPFNFTLPQNIPSSFEHKGGFIRYCIKAIIDRPWKVDHETKIIFQVQTPLELDASSLQREIDDEVNECYCCVLIPCIRPGNVTIRFQLPKTGYYCGDRIEATIDIDNRSDFTSVSRITLALEQKMLFHSKRFQKGRNRTHIIEKVKKMGPFPEKFQQIIGLEVPFIPSSHLQYCSFIDIEYKVLINVHFSGCSTSTKKSYDILIGSMPLPTLPPQQSTSAGFVPSNVPSAPPDFPSSSSYDQTLITPYPMSVPLISPADNSPYPPESVPNNHQPYPSQVGFGFQPPSNIGFEGSNPSAPTSRMPMPLPPSYGPVLTQDTRI